MQRFRIDLKTFLGLAMPNQSCQKLIFDGFMGMIFGQETPNLLYYMIHDVLVIIVLVTVKN